MNEYQADHFVSYFNSFVYKNARSKRFPQSYQVTLFTAEGYDKAYGENQVRNAGTITIMANEDAHKNKIRETPGKETTAVVNDIERHPEFPGGILEFYKFIGKNFKSPADKIEGKILVEFMIEKDGSLSEFQVVKDLGFGLGDEAIRVLKLSPKWNPGIQNGQPVRVLYTLPITIQSSKETK